MTKVAKAERDEAIGKLRAWIKPGDTVYTILEHVSRSGMQREIRAVLLQCEDGRPVDLHPNYNIAKALGLRQGKRDGLIMGGCGMDMGFALVYELSHVLYGGGYACLGKGTCPSSYHNNHRDHVRCDGVIEGETRRNCYAPTPFSRFEVPEDWPRGEHGQLLACLHTEHDGAPYAVCPTCMGEGYLPNPEGPERFDLVHEDGYALRQRWL